MSYTQKLTVVGDIEVGKTYYKNQNISHLFIKIPNIIINSNGGGTINAKLGNEPSDNYKDTEILDLINFNGGYSDIE